MQKYLDRMDSILSKLFGQYTSSMSNPGVLLSGGIDSSTMAAYVSEHFPSFTLLSMGTVKTKDKAYVQLMSSYLKHEYVWVQLQEVKMKENISLIRDLLRQAQVPENLMHLSLAMGYYLIFKKAKELGIGHIITGQGPDILLGGYHKYKSVKDINSEITKDLPLLEIDKRRDGAMAKHFGITLHNPYLESEFVEFCMSVPQEYKLYKGVEKYILRELARTKNLPGEIVNRPKKAFQYSTGLQNTMKNVVS